MRDLRGKTGAIGVPLQQAFRQGAVAPMPPDMAALMRRIDAADAKGKPDGR